MTKHYPEHGLPKDEDERPLTVSDATRMRDALEETLLREVLFFEAQTGLEVALVIIDTTPSAHGPKRALTIRCDLP